MGSGNTKAPQHPVVAYLANGVLTLPVTLVDYQFQMFDEDGVLVYSAFVSAGSVQIVLPQLTGNFEIRLLSDRYYYRGYITL